MKNIDDDPYKGKYSEPAKKYTNKNGHDLRFGKYIGDNEWIPDHPDVIELKKSGEWDTMENIHKRWFKADLYSTEISPETLKELEKSRKKVDRVLKEIYGQDSDRSKKQ